MARSWNGMTILDKKNRATARGLIGFGLQVAVETKTVTHKISGTLARSVHCAPVGYDGEMEGDEGVAESSDMLMTGAEVSSIRRLPALGAVIEVGSWIPYACAEWIGRGHPGVTQGLELATPSANKIFAQAFREEGL
jgi:hypothetical protein